MTFRLSRRGAVRAAATATAAAAALALLAGCATSSGSTSTDSTASITPLTLQTSWIPIVQFGGSYVAETNGYYTQNGVSVDILPGGPNVDPMAAVVSGQADIGMGNADTVAQANQQGADLVIIAAGFQKNPLAILSTSDKPINTPADMVGKKIGVPTGDQPAQDAVLAASGVDPAGVTSVPVGFDVAPLTSGEVDGLWVFYTEQPIAYEAAAGKPGVVMLAADYGLDVYAQVYAVKRSTLEDPAKKTAIEGFLKGEIMGWQDFVKDPTQAVDLTVNTFAKDGGFTIEEQTKQAKLQMDLLVTPDTTANGLLTMTQTGIDKNIKTLASLGITGADASLFDTSLLTDIYAGGNTIK